MRAVAVAGLCAAALLVLFPAGSGRRLEALLLRPTGGRATLRRVAAAPSSSASSMPGPLLLELVAAVLAAGAASSSAARVVGDCLFATDPDAGHALLELAEELSGAQRPRGGACAQEPAPSWQGALRGALRLAGATGVAPVALVQAAAAEQRRAQAVRATIAARRLGVLVVLPTGLFLLPAFVTLTVLPLVLQLLLG